MTTKRVDVLLLVLGALLTPGALPGLAVAQPLSEFTYQGQLKMNNVPVTGTAAIRFRLFDAEEGGNQLGPQSTHYAVDVVNGLFAVRLYFGSAVFNGDPRWLEIAAEFPAYSGNWTLLSPRQRIGSAPYAAYAHRAESAATVDLPFPGTVNTASSPIMVTQTGAGRAAMFSAHSDDAAVYVNQAGTGPGAQFVVNNVGSDEAAVVATSIGSGPGLHAQGASGGPAVKGSALGSGTAATFISEASGYDSPTVYVEHKGLGRCGHFRITNASNTSEAVAASTTGGGVVVSGYTIGGGSAGKFQINNVGNDSPAVLAMTNGTGPAVAAEGTGDVNPEAGGVVVVGLQSGINVALDGNEIMARNNGAVSTLYVNNDGGDVVFGGAIDIGYEVAWDLSTDSTADAVCPEGKKVLGGGCRCGLDDVEDSIPNGNSWHCECSAHLDGVTYAYAICARVK